MYTFNSLFSVLVRFFLLKTVTWMINHTIDCIFCSREQSFGEVIISLHFHIRKLLEVWVHVLNPLSLPSIVLAYKTCSLLNWPSFWVIVSFLSSLASFLLKSSCMIIFRFGWTYFIINALFKNSKSVHAFIYSMSI